MIVSCTSWNVECAPIDHVPSDGTCTWTSAVEQPRALCKRAQNVQFVIFYPKRSLPTHPSFEMHYVYKEKKTSNLWDHPWVQTRWVRVHISAIQNFHQSSHWFLNCATKRQTSAKGKYSNDVFRFFSFRNIKVHARPRRWVLTHSVMLDLTVKSGNIGAVICSASCRTSADRCQNLRFGDSNFRLWCPVHLQLCFSARVNTLRPSSPIIRRSKIAFCRTQRVPPLRDLIRFPTSASLCVTLDYPPRHGQPKSLKTQAVTSISPSSSLRIC